MRITRLGVGIWRCFKQVVLWRDVGMTYIKEGGKGTLFSIICSAGLFFSLQNKPFPPAPSASGYNFHFFHERPSYLAIISAPSPTSRIFLSNSFSSFIALSSHSLWELFGPLACPGAFEGVTDWTFKGLRLKIENKLFYVHLVSFFDKGALEPEKRSLGEQKKK